MTAVTGIGHVFGWAGVGSGDLSGLDSLVAGGGPGDPPSQPAQPR